MIINAALAWWNERPDDIRRCLHGIANIADRVVAVDGAYARYPGATVKSSASQREALVEAAKEFNLELWTPGVDRLWAGQVEKRDFLMRNAAVDCDWIAVVDTDHVIFTDRRLARQELENTPPASDIDVVKVDFVTPDNDKKPEEKAAGNWHLQTGRVSIAHLFRPLPGFRVERFHWWYSALKHGERIWMWGNDESRPLAKPKVMATPYEIQHLTMFRTKEQVLASRAFLNDREMVVEKTGQEDDQPGLPKPKWDYVTMP